METDPFLEIDLFHLSDPAIQELARFTKAHFQLDRAVERAEQLYYTRVVQQMFADSYTHPSEAFVRYCIDEIPEKKNTQTVRAQFTPIVQQAFRSSCMTTSTRSPHGFGTVSCSNLVGAVAPRVPYEIPAHDPGMHDDRDIDTTIITTEEELQALYIIKALPGGTWIRPASLCGTGKPTATSS